MENLDSLKDIWKNQGESSIRFTENDIHKMVQKKSSSIVKWILIISLLEFILPNLIFLLLILIRPSNSMSNMVYLEL